MKKNLQTKIIFGILVLFSNCFLAFNSFNLVDSNQESTGTFNQENNHLKLSGDVLGSHFHREDPTSFVEFPSSPNINTYFYGPSNVTTALKDRDGNRAGVGISVPGYFGVNYSGYSNFESSMHDNIRYINITYRVIFTYMVVVDSEDLVLNFHCDDGTSQNITLFETANDYIELEDSLIIDGANLDQVFNRVKNGGYIESFSLSATTYATGGQFIYVDYFDIYYYYPLIVTRDPIVINSDSDFTPANGVIDGTGTYSDPFIIGNWSINAGWSGSCIYIFGTTEYFRIENCILINSGISSGNAGIRVSNSHNGQILNNEAFNNSEGIFMFNCHYMNISNNKVYNNSKGIYVYSTDNAIISNNMCFNHTIYAQSGIDIVNCYNLTVSNNDCFNNFRGINGQYVFHSSFVANNCTNNEVWGIIISSCEDIIIIDNYCVLNSQANIQLQYGETCKIINNICKNSGSGIYLTDCNNSEISDNDCINSENGIFMYSSYSCRFYRNNISHNGFLGLGISTSKNNEFYDNFISNNSKAVELYGSTENYIHENWIWNNDNNFAGSLDGNYIYNNYFFSIEEHDTDGDGLSDIEELLIGTNPSLVDTDGDNFLDGYEDEYGSNPLDPNDFPRIWQDEFDALVIFLEGNATLLQQVIDWYNKLESYIQGNATLLAEVIIDLGNNSTLLNTVHALATQNSDYLSTINGTLSGRVDDIRAIMDELGISIGDIDYDGLDDLDELSYGTNPTMIDTDLDNLNDAFEIKYGTDPLDDDSDDDGYYDGIELASGNDPLDPNDYPGRVTPSDGVNIPLLVGIIIGIVSAISTGLILGIFFYLKKRKIA